MVAAGEGRAIPKGPKAAGLGEAAALLATVAASAGMAAPLGMTGRAAGTPVGLLGAVGGKEDAPRQ